jgi:hypothetical protein
MRRWLVVLVAITGCAPIDDSVDSVEDGLTGTSNGNETLAGWTTCSNGPGTNCGGAGGAGRIVNTQFNVNVSGGGRGGVAREHTYAGVSYGTSYWYRQTGTPAFLATSIDYETDLYVPSSVGSRYQAIEWDGEQHLNGHLYNYAWQAERGSGKWRWFDYGAGAWRDSGIPFGGFTVDTWHHVHAHYSVSGSTIKNDWLEVDGARHTPTVSTAHQRVGGSGTKMNIGLQLDQDSAGDEMTIYWDNINLSYSDASGPPPPPPPTCSAPKVTSPYDGQGGCGPAIELVTTAPACIVATKCYLASEGGTVVASGAQTIDGVWVSVPKIGADSVTCNGWDSSGKVYSGQPSHFLRTY